MALFIPLSEVFRACCNPNYITRKLRNVKIVANNRKLRSNARIGVLSELDDCRIRVSDWDQNLRLYGQFSAPVKPGSKLSKEEEEKQNYYVNMGHAIRTLREEFPELFRRELSFDIYRHVLCLFSKRIAN